MAETKNYTEIDRPYTSFLERSISEDVKLGANGLSSVDSVGSTSQDRNASLISQGAFDQSSTANQIIKSGSQLTDVWLTSWLRSLNYIPKTQGFNIDARSGSIECMDVWISGVIHATSGSLGNLTLAPGGSLKSGKTAFSDSVNAGWYFGPEGIYEGAAADATYLKYDQAGSSLTVKASLFTLNGQVLDVNNAYGDGSDGDLIISSGTTTLNTAGKTIYRYGNVAITGTAKLTTGANLQNLPVFILVNGNLTITSSSSPAVTVNGMGGRGGDRGKDPATPNGTKGQYAQTSWMTYNQGGGGVSGTLGLEFFGSGGGGGGGLNAVGTSGTSSGGTGASGGYGGAMHIWDDSFPAIRHISNAFMGGGGGGGSVGYMPGFGNLLGGYGGGGGGCIIFIVKGNINLTGILDVSGAPGFDGEGSSDPSNPNGGGGGAGGGGGFLGIFYSGNVIANSPTIWYDGGAGGAGGVTGGSSGKAGGKGTAGNYVIRFFTGILI